jgi:hypothetical protein
MRQPRCDDKLSQVSSPGLTGRSSKSRLLDSITAASGILDRPLSRTMTTEGVAYSNFKQPRLYFEIVIASHRVSPWASPMTGSAKQSMEQQERMDCFLALLMTSL